MADPISAIASLIQTGVNKIFPDANIKTEQALEIAKEVHEELMGQIEINKVEAASSSLFVAGWRPFVGWVCGISLGYNFILEPFIQFLAVLGQIPFDITKLPVLDSGELMSLLMSLLGLGAMRSYDKTQGTSTGH